MVKVVVYRDNFDNITGFRLSGHAGYASSGEDIVCAAVSAIVQTAVIGLTDVIGIVPQYDQQKGNVVCIIPNDLNMQTKEKTSVVLKTMLKGLRSIELQYSSYISINEMEVD